MPESFYAQTPSEFSFIDHYWHMVESEAGSYPLYATVKWGFVFSWLNGATRLQLIGPRTAPAEAPFRAGEYFFGIVINADVNLAGYSKKDLLNQIIEIPVEGNTFMLDGKQFSLPEYDEMDDFTQMLISKDILYAAPIAAISHRDKQRKIKRFTGLTPKQIEQAERVEQAISIINHTDNLSDVAAQVGFSDQAHMTRDFKRLVGYSPAQIKRYFSDSPS